MSVHFRQFNSLRRQSAFTLIEIIVVVAIIGVIVAVLGVKLSRDVDRLARLEAQRFHAVVNEVRDESIIAGESFFLVIDPRAKTYRFDGVRAGRNIDLDNGLLKLRSLEPGVDLDWDVFDQLEGAEDDELKVLISPLGEITPFDAQFSGDENDYHVFINNKNQLEQRIENAKLF